MSLIKNFVTHIHTLSCMHLFNNEGCLYEAQLFKSYTEESKNEKFCKTVCAQLVLIRKKCISVVLWHRLEITLYISSSISIHHLMLHWPFKAFSYILHLFLALIEIISKPACLWCAYVCYGKLKSLHFVRQHLSHSKNIASFLVAPLCKNSFPLKKTGCLFFFSSSLYNYQACTQRNTHTYKRAHLPFSITEPLHGAESPPFSPTGRKLPSWLRTASIQTNNAATVQAKGMTV